MERSSGWNMDCILRYLTMSIMITWMISILPILQLYSHLSFAPIQNKLWLCIKLFNSFWSFDNKRIIMYVIIKLRSFNQSQCDWKEEEKKGSKNKSKAFNDSTSKFQIIVNGMWNSSVGAMGGWGPGGDRAWSVSCVVWAMRIWYAFSINLCLWMTYRFSSFVNVCVKCVIRMCWNAFKNLPPPLPLPKKIDTRKCF